MDEFTLVFSFCVCAFIVWLCMFVLSYRDAGGRNKDNNEPTSKPEGRTEKRKEDHTQKTRKRGNELRWTGRGKQQNFSHPWHLTSFKGHTGEVLDLDFSSNGKYLATCSDDDPGGISTEDSGGSTTSSSLEDNKENTPSSSSETNPRKGLSRRQKKNRKTIDSSQMEPKPKVENVKIKQKSEKAFKTKKMPTLKEYEKFKVPEEYFYSLLHEHVLLPNQLFTLGFPEEYENKVRILKFPFCHANKSTMFFNKEVPSYSDSDQNSNSSNDSLEDTVGGSVPNTYFSPSIMREAFERTCARCATSFFTTSTEYLTTERCQYHWGKAKFLQENKSQKVYSCCKKAYGSSGCTVGRLHVWNGLEAGVNYSLEGFVKTEPKENKKGNYGIFALDCEMCFTVKGLELCKVTIVGMDGRLVYNSLVKPESEVIDYNTRFSGVTEQDLNNENVKTLSEVQKDLLGFINDKTILIGHALDNDFRALKLLHSRVVDTSLSFPHDRGLPYRWSLKTLVSEYLRRDIQTSLMGHNSYEDAASCMELMLWKIRCSLRGSRFYGVPSYQAFP